MAKQRKAWRDGPHSASFLQDLVRTLGRNLLFIDTGAILHQFDRQDMRYKHFIEAENQDRLVTSQFIVNETIRRLVKSSATNAWAGPGGQRAKHLAQYFVTRWLKENNVYVIHIPESVFNEAVERFAGDKIEKCDLVDVISLVIVRGLGQQRILAEDRHFIYLGLNVLPG